MRSKSNSADAIEFIGENGNHSEKAEEPAASKSMATKASDKDGQGWVSGAIGKEGMDVSMAEGQVNGDPALQMKSETNAKAWNAVKLESGQEGVAAPEDAKKDPGKGRVVNVVVWFGPMDSEVSWTVLLPSSQLTLDRILSIGHTANVPSSQARSTF